MNVSDALFTLQLFLSTKISVLNGVLIIHFQSVEKMYKIINYTNFDPW